MTDFTMQQENIRNCTIAEMKPVYFITFTESKFALSNLELIINNSFSMLGWSNFLFTDNIHMCLFYWKISTGSDSALSKMFIHMLSVIDQAEWMSNVLLSIDESRYFHQYYNGGLKVRSHGAVAAAIFLPQQPESVHTVWLQLSYIFK